MSEEKPVIFNVGDLAEPVTALVNRVSDALGGLALPWQIVRVARAEAEAEKIKALAGVEVTEIQKRGLVRLINETGRQQQNVEDVTAKALPNVKADAKPEEIEEDWLVNFFDKCKNISDEEMQSLWAKLLAGEANAPGKYSKRTVNFIAGLDKEEAEMFSHLCSFGAYLKSLFLFIYDLKDELFIRNKVTYANLIHLESIGLLIVNTAGITFFSDGAPKRLRFNYFGTPIDLEFENPQKNRFELGRVKLTKMGEQLAPISGAEKSEEFLDYLVNRWQEFGYRPSCPLDHTAPFYADE